MHLTLDGNEIEDGGLKALASARWPNLGTLCLAVNGDEPYEWEEYFCNSTLKLFKRSFPRASLQLGAHFVQ